MTFAQLLSGEDAAAFMCSEDVSSPNTPLCHVDGSRKTCFSCSIACVTRDADRGRRHGTHGRKEVAPEDSSPDQK